ncbi:MAG: hypothetical protein R3Y10_02085, partial [Ferrimonas sp.]
MSIINETLKQLERSGRDPSLLARMPKNANAAVATPEASGKPWLWFGLPVLAALLLWQWWPLLSGWITPNHGRPMTPAIVATPAVPEQPLDVIAKASEKTPPLAADNTLIEAVFEAADSAVPAPTQEASVAVAAAPAQAAPESVKAAAPAPKASVAVAAAPAQAAPESVKAAAPAPK